MSGVRAAATSTGLGSCRSAVCPLRAVRPRVIPLALPQPTVCPAGKALVPVDALEAQLAATDLAGAQALVSAGQHGVGVAGRTALSGDCFRLRRSGLNARSRCGTEQGEGSNQTGGTGTSRTGQETTFQHSGFRTTASMAAIAETCQLVVLQERRSRVMAARRSRLTAPAVPLAAARTHPTCTSTSPPTSADSGSRPASPRRRSAMPAACTAPRSACSERAAREPRLSTMVKLARALRVELSELLAGIR